MTRKISMSIFISSITLGLQAQKVGIGTNQPLSPLHVQNGSVLFTATTLDDVTNPPVTGQGNRMFWYASKAAFRTGSALSSEWNRDNVGRYSFASGLGNYASGESSHVLGSYSTSAGEASAAIGIYSRATATAAIAIGGRDTATQPYATAIGYGNIAKASFAVAIGRSNEANAGSSTAIGTDLMANVYGCTVIGISNEPIPGATSESNNPNPLDPLLIIGNGNVNGRSNALVVTRGGRLGIGTNTPAALMHLSSGSSTGNAQLLLEEKGDASDGARVTFRNAARADKYWDLWGYTDATLANAAFNFYYSGGNNIFSLSGNGNAWLKGTLTQNSDARLKKDIAPLDNVLDKLEQLGGYHYRWQDAGRDPSLQTGLLAQEVEKQMPELVKEDKDGIKSVNYSGLIPYLLEAIKQQQQEINELKRALSRL